MNDTQRQRFLIVKINHLAERLEENIDQPVACYTTRLYAPPDGVLHRGHTQLVADALAQTAVPEDVKPLARELRQAVIELQSELPHAPAPIPAPAPAPSVFPTLQPVPEPAAASPRAGGLRQAAGFIRRALPSFRREESISPASMQATAGILACAPIKQPF